MRSRGSGSGGNVLVEAALVISLLLLLVMGILELGRAWFSFNLLTHAVREAARRASVTPGLQQNDPQILSDIETTLNQGGVEASVRSVSFPTPLRTGALVHVSAEVEFSPLISLIFSQAGTAAIPLRAEVVTRYEM